MTQNLTPFERKRHYQGTTRAIKATGKVIKIKHYIPDAGTFEGEQCDLIQYMDNGIRKVIESPKVEL